jgi:hypothetical protein
MQCCALYSTEKYACLSCLLQLSAQLTVMLNTMTEQHAHDIPLAVLLPAPLAVLLILLR